MRQRPNDKLNPGQYLRSVGQTVIISLALVLPFGVVVDQFPLFSGDPEL
ncbi:MAG: hypothetical protein R2751_15875 [Bacteroidales bacterium]